MVLVREGVWWCNSEQWLAMFSWCCWHRHRHRHCRVGVRLLRLAERLGLGCEWHCKIVSSGVIGPASRESIAGCEWRTYGVESLEISDM